MARKLLAVILILLCCVSWLTACGDAPPESGASESLMVESSATSGDSATIETITTGSGESSAADSQTTGGSATGGQATGNNTTGKIPGITKSTQQSTQQPTQAPTQNPADKPSGSNIAGPITPMKGKSDGVASILRSRILSAKDATVSVSGKTYYISHKGNDGNSGTSPAQAWKTTGKLEASRAKLHKGDAVLFERGGVYHGGIQTVSGVHYGAYGSGDKPAIYGSNANAAESTWTKHANNIWVSPKSYTADVGIIVFDHGKGVGDKKFKMEDLKEDYDFFFAAGKVYLYMSGEPSSKFSSIEVGRNVHVINIPSGCSDVTIDNLTLKYTGNSGVYLNGNNKNIAVTNCEIGWIGGSIQSGTTRLGNGMTLWNGGENIRVESCWIYQIYDSALSHQGRGEFVVKDLTFADNLVEYTSYGAIEYWAPDASQNELINVTYSGNILRFSGYGWGELGRRAPGMGILGEGANKSTNMKIINNVIDSTRVYPLDIIHRFGTLPDLEGNTLYQPKRSYIGCWGTSGSGSRYVFDDNALNTLKTVFGDTSAKVAYNE